MSQLGGVPAAVVTMGDAAIAANITATATQYNYLSHSDLERAANQLAGCGSDADCAKETHTTFYEKSLKQEADADAYAACGKDPSSCEAVSRIVASADADRAQFRALLEDSPPETRQVLDGLISENDGFQNSLAGVTAGHSSAAVADYLIGWGFTPERAAEAALGFKLTASFLAGKASGSAGAKDFTANLSDVWNLEPT